MSNSFNFSFWKKDYITRFSLDREGKEILDYFVAVAPAGAEEFFKDKYQSEVWKEGIIDTYCNKYDVNKINKLLKELDFDELTEEEIMKYEIESNEDEMEG